MPHLSSYCHSLSFAPVNPDWFYLPGAGSPGQSRTKSKRAVKRLCVCVCVSESHMFWHKFHWFDLLWTCRTAVFHTTLSSFLTAHQHIIGYSVPFFTPHPPYLNMARCCRFVINISMCCVRSCTTNHITVVVSLCDIISNLRAVKITSGSLLCDQRPSHNSQLLITTHCFNKKTSTWIFGYNFRKCWPIFGRPYYRSSLWYSMSSVVVCLSSSVCRLWRFVLWQNGAS